MTTSTGSRIRLLAGTALALGVLAGCASSPAASPAAPAMTTMPASDPDGMGRHSHNFSFSSFPWQAGALSHYPLNSDDRRATFRL